MKYKVGDEVLLSNDLTQHFKIEHIYKKKWFNGIEKDKIVLSNEKVYDIDDVAPYSREILHLAVCVDLLMKNQKDISCFIGQVKQLQSKLDKHIAETPVKAKKK